MGIERTYTNPLYDGYLADPFVLEFNGKYYAYGTVPTGTCAIPVLHSTDLVEWTRLGNALEPIGQEFECYWAPEVAYNNGTFFMYYSAGGEAGEGHQIRVATADHLAGPYRIESSRVFPEVLHTVPGRVIGPGHCSITLAPDNLHPYMIYHAWDVEHTARQMRMDALVWATMGPI